MIDCRREDKASRARTPTAICSDCHNPHGIDKTSSDVAKLAAVKACAGCQKDNAESYGDTYHGQITALGYTNTAKCFNCHGSHDILGPTDPKSKVYPDNRLKTCQTCQKQAKLPVAATRPPFISSGRRLAPAESLRSDGRRPEPPERAVT